MRNYFNVVRSVGLLFFGVGTFLVGITLPEFMERITRDYIGEYYSTNVWDDGLVVYLILGLSFLIAGLGGLLKTRWFPKAGIVVLILAFLGFSFLCFKVLIPNSRGDEIFYAIGLLLMVYCIITCFMLLMNNQYFLEALYGEDDKEEEDERILDAW